MRAPAVGYLPEPTNLAMLLSMNLLLPDVEGRGTMLTERAYLLHDNRQPQVGMGGVIFLRRRLHARTSRHIDCRGFGPVADERIYWMPITSITSSHSSRQVIL